METIIAFGTSPEEIRMPSETKERARVVLSLCKKMKECKTVIYVGDEPFCYASSPEFISRINTYYPFDLDIVWNEFHDELLEIQNSRVEYMNKIMSK